MAPELLQRGSYDYTVDIWALGILLYELMHGYSPFRAKKIKDIYNKIKKQRIHFHKSITEEVKELITGILKITPSERMSIEEILEHPWVKKYANL